MSCAAMVAACVRGGIKKRARACLELGARVVGLEGGAEGNGWGQVRCVEGEEKAGVCCQQAEQEPGVVSLYKLFAPSQGVTVSHSLLKTEWIERRGAYFALPLD